MAVAGWGQGLGCLSNENVDAAPMGGGYMVHGSGRDRRVGARAQIRGGSRVAATVARCLEAELSNARLRARASEHRPIAAQLLEARAQCADLAPLLGAIGGPAAPRRRSFNEMGRIGALLAIPPTRQPSPFPPPMDPTAGGPLFAAAFVGEPGELERIASPPHPPLDDGRSTPACYRPMRQGSGPLPPALHRRTQSAQTPQRSSSTATAIDALPAPSAVLAPRPAPFHYGTPAAHDPPEYFPPTPPSADAPIRPLARRGSFTLPHPPPRRARRSSEAVLLGAPAPVAYAGHRIPRTVQLRRLLSALVRALHTCGWLLFHPRAAAGQTGRRLHRTLSALDAAFRDPPTGERVWRPPWLHAYIPFLIWGFISLISTTVVLTHHALVFSALDRLARTLVQLGWVGYASLAALVALTTIPPVPLYSTLVVLSGYTFGLWPGFATAYIGALGGGVGVFCLSRSWLRGPMQRLLSKSQGLQKIVRAIDRKPQLLFLIRLAPYPYNLLNTVLAASPTLTLRTYTLCTALALPKLLVHVGIGAMTKSFAAPADHAAGAEADPQSPAVQHTLWARQAMGVGGVILCIGIFIYLLRVARQAVDELDLGEYHALPPLPASQQSHEALVPTLETAPAPSLALAARASTSARREAKYSAHAPQASSAGTAAPTPTPAPAPAPAPSEARPHLAQLHLHRRTPSHTPTRICTSPTAPLSASPSPSPRGIRSPLVPA